jgi:GT2 family glycosyltransferase
MATYFEQYQILSACGLFDPVWYLATYPEVAGAGLDPISHYLEIGAAEGRNPGPAFDTAHYLERCRHIGEQPDNPLLHFLEHGAAAGLTPMPEPEPAAPAVFDLFIEQLLVSGSGHLFLAGRVVGADPVIALDISFAGRTLGTAVTADADGPAGITQVAQFAFTGDLGNLPAVPQRLLLRRRFASGRVETTCLLLSLAPDAAPGAENIVEAAELLEPIALFVDRPSLAEGEPVPISGDLEITGWAIGEGGIDSIDIRVDGNLAAQVRCTVVREDVRAAFPDAAESFRSGFEAVVPQRQLSAGEHRVEIRALDAGRNEKSVAFLIRADAAPPPPPVYADLLYAEILARLRQAVAIAPEHASGLIADVLALLPARPVADASQTLATLLDVMRLFGGQKAGTSAEYLAALRARYAPIAFAPATDPVVSIVIPACNHLFHVYRCLESLSRHPPSAAFEIILVDDYSTDDTIHIASLVSGVTLLRNPRNRGFIESCHLGADAARGDFLFFLNSDAMVTAHAVDELVACFAHPEAGLVGAKLVYPDGRLQEAGAIVWRNGTGGNYGRFEDPWHPDYNYRRSVDYCSGAALMIRRSLWQELGGFDRAYDPAYFEDADLAFRVRAAGYAVWYQPLAMVIHCEGVSAGRDLASGMKAGFLGNERLFRDRWAAVLAGHAPRGTAVLRERDRACRGRVLFIDATTPMPDQDAGSNVAFQHMRILQSLGYKVTFIPLQNFAFVSRYTPALQREGIEAIYTPGYGRLDRFLEARGPEFDLVYLHRFEIAEQCIGLLRRHAPRAPLVFNPADLSHLRLERQAALGGSPADQARAAETRKRELAVIAAADLTLLCNSHEMALLSDGVAADRLYYLPWVIDVETRPLPGFGERHGILFVGGFGHPPNVDAVVHFVGTIMPHVRRLLPGVKCHIYGSRMSDAVRALAAEDVVIEGHVPDLAQAFDRHRVSIAPLRYGAGFKGKVASSLAHGVPAVVSPIAAEGSGLIDGLDFLVAEQPEAFAAALARLYNEQVLWEAMSAAGLAHVSELFSVEAGRRHFRNIIGRLERFRVVARTERTPVQS